MITIQQPAATARETLRTYFLTGAPIPSWRTAAEVAATSVHGYPLVTGDPVRPLLAVASEIIGRDAAAFPILAGHLPVLAACLTTTLEQAAAPMAEALTLSDDGRIQLAAELTRVSRRLPKDVRLVSFHESVLSDLVTARLTALRRPAMAALLAEAASARDRLLELLQPVQPVAETFGAGAVTFIDTGRLASMTRPAGSQPLAPARRWRLTDALSVLEAFINEAKGWPPFWISGLDTGLARAADLVKLLSRVLRALRVTTLECDGAYDEQRHPLQIERLHASPSDLHSAPPMIVMLAAEEFEHLPIRVWNQLLHAGYPLTVLLHAPGPNALDPFLLRSAIGQALVCQTALAEAGHLLATVDQVAGAKGPAIVVYSRHPWAPLFYAAPDAPMAVEYLDLDVPPPAHAPIIPSDAWEDEQVEFSQWLDRPEAAIPFLWVKDEAGARQRAALAESDVTPYRRLQAWREAIAPKPAPVVVPASDEQLEQARRDGATTAVFRLVAYLTGATPPPDTVAAAPPPSLVAPSADLATAPVPAQASPPPAPAPASPNEAEAATTDPYIDSFLCTSCNDCMKVNPRLFLYDGNKQAYLGPLTAGTFADLVKAAEGCPAKCIHPGAPQPGDTTATPALVARAARFK